MNKGADIDLLIVFTNIYIGYSPSTLNIFNFFIRKGLTVKMIAQNPKHHFSKAVIKHPEIIYLYKLDVKEEKNVIKKISDRLLKKIYSINKKGLTRKDRIWVNWIRKINAKQILAVDSYAQWLVQNSGKRSYLLSLELPNNDKYIKDLNEKFIKGLLIQTEERLLFFKNATGIRNLSWQEFPNSSNYIPLQNLSRTKSKFDLVYSGSCMSEFGIYSCLDFITLYPEYRITIIGNVSDEEMKFIKQKYLRFLENGSIIIDHKYYGNEELIAKISEFFIGFVFYDDFRFKEMRQFNFQTAPSGKLFVYANAGVPIIGNDIPGLSLINKYNAGILIPFLTPTHIKAAIDEIESNYEKVTSNARDMAKDFDMSQYLLECEKFIFGNNL